MADNTYTIQVKDKTELQILIIQTMQQKGANCDLNFIDTSLITDMSELFTEVDDLPNGHLLATFNGRIDKWNVENVTNMSSMFYYAKDFNQPINDWNVAKVTDMSYMFCGARAFNQPLDKWDVSQVTDMSSMFNEASSFNQSLNDWNVANVVDMAAMFYCAEDFNQPLNNWNVAKVVDMSLMFTGASAFNQPLNNWHVISADDLSFMFNDAIAFNQPLNDWNVSSVADMTEMFSGATAFNQPLDQWDVSNVTHMSGMFENAHAFKQSLRNWHVENALVKTNMFTGTQITDEDRPEPTSKAYTYTVHVSSELMEVRLGSVPKDVLKCIKTTYKGSPAKYNLAVQKDKVPEMYCYTNLHRDLSNYVQYGNYSGVFFDDSFSLAIENEYTHEAPQVKDLTQIPIKVLTKIPSPQPGQLYMVWCGQGCAEYKGTIELSQPFELRGVL